MYDLILGADLYIICPGVRVLAAIRFNVTFLIFEALLKKMCTCFSKDTEI